jgi:anti-sigma-K factor RskA
MRRVVGIARRRSGRRRQADEEIAALTDAWRLALRDLPTVDIGVTAAEVLDELYADGDL